MKEMKRVIYYMISIIMTTLVACSDDVDGVDSGVDSVERSRISVSLDQTTRIGLDGAYVSWQEDESLYLYNMDRVDYMQYLFTIDNSSISEDGKNADFVSTSTLEEGCRYIAVTRGPSGYGSDHYGIDIYDAVWDDDTQSDMHSSQSESGSDSHIENTLLMSSQIFTYSSSTTTVLYFSLEQSILELDIKMASGVIGSYEIGSVSLFSENNNFFSCINLYLDGFLGTKSTWSDSTNKISVSVASALLSSADSYKLYIPICWVDNSTVSGDFTLSIRTTTGKYATTSFEAKELSDGTIYTKSLEFDEPKDMSDYEMDTLIELYSYWGGSSWGVNWSKSTPLEQWDRVSLDGDGLVVELGLYGLGITGDIPYSILTQLSALESLSLSDNNITGTLDGISALSNIKELDLGYNNISGTIPDELYTLTKLEYLFLESTNLDGSLSEDLGNLTSLREVAISLTNISGSIPSSITNLVNLDYLYMHNNKLSGVIPVGLLSMGIEKIYLMYNNFTGDGNEALYSDSALWSRYAWDILRQNDGYGFSDDFRQIYLEDSELVLADGTTISSSDYFAKSDYTCIVYYSKYDSSDLFDVAQLSYDAYNASGLGVLTSYNDATESLVATNGWRGDFYTNNAFSDYVSVNYYLVVDRNGMVVSSPLIDDSISMSDIYSGATEASCELLTNLLADIFKDTTERYFSISPTTAQEISRSGGTLVVSIVSNASWSLSTTASWITLSSTSGSENAECKIAVEANTSGEPRSATVTFVCNDADKTITLDVTQGDGDMINDLIQNYL